MLLLPVPDPFRILGIPEVIPVLGPGQPCSLRLPLPGLTTLRFEAKALARAAPIVGKKKFPCSSNTYGWIAAASSVPKSKGTKYPKPRNREGRKSTRRKLKPTKKEEEFSGNLPKKIQTQKIPFQTVRFAPLLVR
jgi:hypothetical protein